MTGLHRADLDLADVGDLGEVPLATIGGRVLARLIDTVVVAVPAVIAAWLFTAGDPGAAVLIVPLLVGLVYEVVLTALRGTTPGKRLLGIDVVDARTGLPPGWGKALARAVVLPLTPVVNVLVTLFTEHRRGPHDYAAGTVLVLIGRR